MVFKKMLKQKSSKDGKVFAVFMNHNKREHYVCDLYEGDTPEAAAANELGLTIRSRLLRSGGESAMLEGSIFNPSRLLDIVCAVTDYTAEKVEGFNNVKGYTLLTITADGCVNKYMVFSEYTLERLTSKLKTLMPKKEA
jgi:hypothetical protein